MHVRPRVCACACTCVRVRLYVRAHIRVCVCVCACVSVSVSPPHQVSLQPLPQAEGGGVGDLAAQALLLLVVHELQHAAQVLQEMQRPQVAHEGRCGRLAVKHAVGVVQGLGA